MNQLNKGVLIVIVVGMLGWVVYDVLFSAEETSFQEEEIAGINSQLNDEVEEIVESDDIGLSLGKMAPDFELVTLDGETVRLSDYRGRKVFLNFWATWCPPCREEMPDMQKLYENNDIEILAVNLFETERNEEHVTEFVEDFELTFPVLMDENSDVSNNYQVQAYPTSYLIDSNGRIQFIALGAMNYDQMEREMEKME